MCYSVCKRATDHERWISYAMGAKMRATAGHQSADSPGSQNAYCPLRVASVAGAPRKISLNARDRSGALPRAEGALLIKGGARHSESRERGRSIRAYQHQY